MRKRRETREDGGRLPVVRRWQRIADGLWSERERVNRSDLRVVGAQAAGLPSPLFFYYVFQSSVGQLTIITSRVIPKADRLEGENVTSPRRDELYERRGGWGEREEGEEGRGL